LSQSRLIETITGQLDRHTRFLREDEASGSASYGILVGAKDEGNRAIRTDMVEFQWLIISSLVCGPSIGGHPAYVVVSPAGLEEP